MNPTWNKLVRVDYCKCVSSQNGSTHFDMINKWVRFGLSHWSYILTSTWHEPDLPTWIAKAGLGFGLRLVTLTRVNQPTWSDWNGLCPLRFRSIIRLQLEFTRGNCYCLVDLLIIQVKTLQQLERNCRRERKNKSFIRGKCYCQVDFLINQANMPLLNSSYHLNN